MNQRRTILSIISIVFLLVMVFIAGRYTPTKKRVSTDLINPMLCPSIQEVTWQLNLPHHMATAIKYAPHQDFPCIPEEKSNATNIRLDIENGQKKIVYSTYITADFFTYYDEIKDGKLTGGAAKSDDVIIRTTLPYGEAKLKNSTIRFVDQGTNLLIATGRLN